MGFLKALQKKLEVATKTSGSSEKHTYVSNLDEAYFDFEDHYENKCEKMGYKIDDVETDNMDPDKNISAFKKKLELLRELENFCVSHGSGGKAYFKENFAYLYKQIQDDLDCYMKNEYDEAKQYFEEEKERQKAINKLEKRILREIQNSNGCIMQKNLKKLLTEDELVYFNIVIKSLLSSNKISRFKEGNSVCFKTI